MENTAKKASELKGKSGILRLFNALRYSKQGFIAAWRTEQAFRQELILACVMLPVAILLPLDWMEKLLMVIAVINVLTVEILNSALEAVVDRFGEEIHPLSGKAKDLGSAAVFLALLICAIVWLTILVHRFTNLFA
ncbi:MAG: diacylglycerol kinase [Burkholderiaceae bacterium]|nr:diacylglycerol kinase [Burkholderiaceae bacterium]